MPQERTQTLNEGIFQQRFAVGFRDEKPVQANVERLGDLLQRAEARRHLAAFDAGEVGARDLRARLQLALGHAARFPQLANALADILDRLLVDELFWGWFSGLFLRRCRWRNQELQTLRQGARPFQQDLSFNSPLIAVLDNNLYHQYAVLARIYDWSKRGVQTFPVIIPQELTPGSITVESTGSASAEGKTYEGLKVSTSDLQILVLLDDHHRLMRLEVPDAKVSVVRE